MNGLHAFYPGEPAAVSIGVYLAQMTLLLAVGLTAGRWFRWEAAKRHHILLVTWVGVAAIPLLSWGLSASNTSTAFQEKLRSGYAAITHHAEPAATVAVLEAAAQAPLALPVTGELPPSVETSVFPYETAFSLLGLAWLAGTLVMAVRLAGSARKLARIHRNSTPLRTNHPLVEVCRSAAGNSGAARTPEIRLSNQCNSPVVIGLLRPTLLFPQRLLGTLSGDALRHVLEHEMAHVARRDYLAVWLQHAFAVLFWFHPLVHLFNRQLAQVREELCDNHVLKSAQETEYGYTLLSVAEAIGGIAPPQPAVGLLTVNWSLESRIAQILHHRRKIMTRVSLQHACATSLGALATTLALALCHPAMAEDADDVKGRRKPVTIQLEGIDLQQLKQKEMPERQLLMILQRLLEAERKQATMSIEGKTITIRQEEFDPFETDLIEGKSVKVHKEEADQRRKELQQQQKKMEQELLEAERLLLEAERKLATESTAGKSVKVRMEVVDPFATDLIQEKPVKFHIGEESDPLETKSIKSIEGKPAELQKKGIDLQRKELQLRLKELQMLQRKMEQELLIMAEQESQETE